MNENHRRHLAATFRYIDSLLGEAARLLDVPASSAFERHVMDAAPVQRMEAAERIAALRATMMRFAADCAVEFPAAPGGARGMARGMIGGARIVLDEILPPVMRGYGPLEADDAPRLEAFVAAMDDALARLDALLAREPDISP
jgi:hypothetical protein